MLHFRGGVMAESYSRGHKIICTDGKTWKYVDTGEPVSSERPCARCGRKPINGEDACLGHIEGVISACCGHGMSNPIIVYKEDVK